MPTDQYREPLDELPKESGRTVSGLAAPEPADCKALPYDVANPPFLDDRRCQRDSIMPPSEPGSFIGQRRQCVSASRQDGPLAG